MKHMWSEEEIQSFKKDISNLVDSKGNPRFIEGNGTPETLEGFTSTYCKWSLSGTHLMCVLVGSVTNGTNITGIAASFNVPQFIFNKVAGTFGAGIIEVKNIPLYANTWQSQTSAMQFRKDTTNNKLDIYFGDLTLTADRNFRVQFDLLIDSE